MKKRIYLFLVCLLGLSSAFVMFGCESAEGYGLTINTSSYTVTKKAPSVVLSAKGWSDYKWSLSDESIGRLSSQNGETVTYTGTVFGENTSTNATSSKYVQKITVSARELVNQTTTSSGSSTNHVTTTTSSDVYSGSIYITHK